MITFRHADPRYPFLWETADQPEGRWHLAGEGPVHYLADTPDGAWAEFLRHEEITDPEDIAGIARDIWAIELPDDQVPTAAPELHPAALTGGTDTYYACRHAARRLREREIGGLNAPSAALLPGAAHGHRVNGGQRPAPRRSGRVFVLFGPNPSLIGWRVVARGRPHPELLACVRPLTPA